MHEIVEFSLLIRINSRSVHYWYQWQNSDYEGRLRLFRITLNHLKSLYILHNNNTCINSLGVWRLENGNKLLFSLSILIKFNSLSLCWLYIYDDCIFYVDIYVHFVRFDVYLSCIFATRKQYACWLSLIHTFKPNHFWSHCSPFLINTQHFFINYLFTNWASLDGHFGWPKITFDRISRHFRSIRNFIYLFIFSKWPPVAILEAQFVVKIDRDLPL